MSPPVKQCTFAGGEITPAAWARSDLPLYEKSAHTLRNMICMKHGGVTGRPPTMYVGTTFNGGNPVRLIPFIFNETGLGQSYILEFGNEYITFYQNGGVVEVVTKPIAGTMQTNPCSVEVVAHGFSTGDYITIEGVPGMTQLNDKNFIITVTDTNDFTLSDMLGNPIDATGYDFSPGGGTATKIYKIATPYLQADLATIQFAQSADILTIVHPNYPVRELARLAPTNWALTTPILISPMGEVLGLVASGGGSGTNNFGYYVTAVNAQGDETEIDRSGGVGVFNVAPLSPTNFVTITWTAFPGAVTYNVYKLLSNISGSSPGYIGNTFGTTFADTGLNPDFSNEGVYTNPFYQMTPGNCPSTVGFIQQRRCFGATNNNPIGFWMSRSGSFYNFSSHAVTVTDDDPIIGSIAGEEVNAIQHLLELKFALMLTAGAEIYVQGNGSGVITPSAINASVQSQYGCAPLRPLKTGDVLIFNQALGSKIRDFAFDFAIDGYRGNDISIFASHLFEGYQIVDWCYQKEPDSIIWAVRSDGVLLSCTYIREQQVLAWTHHDFANGFVENICAIPENGEYAVYAVIKRNIGGYFSFSSTHGNFALEWNLINGNAQTVAFGATLGWAIPGEYQAASGPPYVVTATNPVLSSTITIVAGVNDQFQTYGRAATTIPAGTYTGTALAAAIQTAILANYPDYNFTVGYSEPTIRYVERMASRIWQGPTAAVAVGTANAIGDPVDAPFCDCFAQYDGRNTSGTTMILVDTNPPFIQGATAYQQQLTLLSSVPFFTPSMVGDQIFIYDSLFVSSQGSKGNQIRCTIQIFSTTTNVVVTPDRAVPIEFQKIATTLWSRAVKTISGLNYLQAQQVSVWADRFVVGSPLNSSYSAVYTVPASGILTLDKPYSVIYVGLPMIQDIETLDLETYFGETIMGRRKRVAGLQGYIYQTRSFYAGSENPDTNNQNASGDPLFQLFPLRTGISQESYDQPPQLLTAQDYLITTARWNKNGRIFMRNVDPLPWTLLAVSPKEEDAVTTPYKRV